MIASTAARRLVNGFNRACFDSGDDRFHGCLSALPPFRAVTERVPWRAT